jgi:hypothetical protein
MKTVGLNGFEITGGSLILKYRKNHNWLFFHEIQMTAQH